MWKIQTAQIYDSLISRGLFSAKQKGYHKGSSRTGKRLYIDQHILKEIKTRWKNLAVVWIDNEQAYDMVTQSWIIDSIKMYKISSEVIKFAENTMENCTVEMTAGRKSLSYVKILRGIFQGDALSLLLFVIARLPLNHIHRKCIGRYKLTKSREKISHLIYMDIKLFAKNEKELETRIQAERIHNKYIGTEFGTEKYPCQ